MGLNISHGAWDGPYSSFNGWRQKVAHLAGYPPLELMDGYYYENGFSHPFTLLDLQYPKGNELEMYAIRKIRKELPIKWDNFKPNPLIKLLLHSDCEGYINCKDCKGIADELEKIIGLSDEADVYWIEKTKRFITGCRLAYEKKEKLIFS